MRKKISIFLSSTLIFSCLIQSIPTFADDLNHNVTSISQKEIKTGITEEGIPYIVNEIKTEVINTKTRAVMTVEVERQMVYKFSTEQLAKDFKPPKELYWSEDLGGNGNFTGTLKFMGSTWSASAPKQVTARYKGKLVGRS